MIQRLGAQGLIFKANELPSARSAYSFQLDKNNKTAQMQAENSSNITKSVNNTQIPMQGQVSNNLGKKLDVIA